MEGVRFEHVKDVARWLKDELDAFHIPAYLKTSGSTGLHVFVSICMSRPRQKTA